MEIIDTDALQWAGGAEHRSGGVMFKTMFAGTEGEAGNYWYTLVRISDYHAPTHRHNFDQVRYMLDGRFGFGDAVQEEGSVGYFTEGLPYTQTSMGNNVHLLLQCEGGSRSPYLSPEQVKRAAGELAKIGSFDGGRYTAPAPGSTPIDGFEAVWQHVTGASVSYSSPRYSEPLILEPERFAFVESDQAGLSSKALGSFTEREIAIGFQKVEAGCTVTIAPTGQTTLFFVREGHGTCSSAVVLDKQAYVANTAVLVAAEEALMVSASSQTNLFVIRLPR
jgi:hypothetical protein